MLILGSVHRTLYGVRIDSRILSDLVVAGMLSDCSMYGMEFVLYDGSM